LDDGSSNQGENRAVTVTFADIEAAARRIEGKIVATPTLRSETLSRIIGAEVWLKYENLQFTASFKDRGAANKLLQLTGAEARAGVIAMSAGNHAQAVALHAGRLGIAATIVMPRSTPNVKVANTRNLGARVLLEGDSLAEAAVFARETARREGLVFVHPYDDPAVVAGQGTAALEMVRAAPDLDQIIVPVGGGGLAAGAAIVLAAARPSTTVLGVEVENYGAAAQRLHGDPVSVGGATVAEGIAVRDVGDMPLEILRSHDVEVILVPEREIEHAIIMLIEIEKTVAEGAGAIGLAALLTHPERFRGKKIGVIISGGNIDTRLLANVLMRGLARDGRLVRLSIDIADQPGALAKVAGVIAGLNGNVIDVQHQRLFGAFPVKSAELEVIVETQDHFHSERIINALGETGMTVRSSLPE
jgi:threonine dehydratase